MFDSYLPPIDSQMSLADFCDSLCEHICVVESYVPPCAWHIFAEFMRLLFPVAQAASGSTSAAIIRIRIELLMNSSCIVALSPESARLYCARSCPAHWPFDLGISSHSPRRETAPVLREDRRRHRSCLGATPRAVR